MKYLDCVVTSLAASALLGTTAANETVQIDEREWSTTPPPQRSKRKRGRETRGSTAKGVLGSPVKWATTSPF